MARAKDWRPSGGMSPLSKDHPLQEDAERAVRETAGLKEFSYIGDVPLGMTWALTVNQTRDSKIREKSNYAGVLRAMEEKFPRDVEVIHSSHGAVGWVDQIAVRVLDPRGTITPAGEAILEWREYIEDGELVDEADYYDRLYEASLENLGWMVRDYDVPKAKLPLVYDWLRENYENEMEEPGEGAEPEERLVHLALVALGFKEPETEEEGLTLEEAERRRRDRGGDPFQMKLFGRRRG